jgi:hypothetical protein
MSGVVPLLPPYVFMACTGKTLPLIQQRFFFNSVDFIGCITSIGVIIFISGIEGSGV